MNTEQPQATNETAGGGSALTAELATQTRAMPRDMQPVSVETMRRAMQEIDLLTKPDQWILVDPQGRMYKGTVEQMTRLLAQHHPLLHTV